MTKYNYGMLVLAGVAIEEMIHAARAGNWRRRLTSWAWLFIPCAAALGMFLLKMLNNGLPSPIDPSARAHYQAVSTAYSGGFATGFFLCFFLMLLAMAAAAWLDQRREQARLARESPVPREREGAVPL